MAPAQVGAIPTTLPPVVVGALDLTQSQAGPAKDLTADTRGLVSLTAGPAYFSNSTPVCLPRCHPCTHAAETPAGKPCSRQLLQCHRMFPNSLNDVAWRPVGTQSGAQGFFTAMSPMQVVVATVPGGGISATVAAGG